MRPTRLSWRSALRILTSRSVLKHVSVWWNGEIFLMATRSPLQRCVAWVTTPVAAPAVTALSPDARGRISVGRPADLVLCDINAPFILDASSLVSKSKNSPFDGRRLQGKVLMTMVGGRTAYRAT